MQRTRSNKEFLKYAEQAFYVIFQVLVFHGCIYYYCNNSGMVFLYSVCIPKGLPLGCLRVSFNVCGRLFQNEEYSRAFFACLFVLDCVCRFSVWGFRYVSGHLL